MDIRFFFCFIFNHLWEELPEHLGWILLQYVFINIKYLFWSIILPKCLPPSGYCIAAQMGNLLLTFKSVRFEFSLLCLLRIYFFYFWLYCCRNVICIAWYCFYQTIDRRYCFELPSLISFIRVLSNPRPSQYHKKTYENLKTVKWKHLAIHYNM